MSNLHRLGLVLGLLAAAAGLVHGTPPLPARVRPAYLDRVPLALAGWTATPGVPVAVLPPDPRAAAVIHRTYRSGARTVWVSVALFTGQDDPSRRASLGLIHLDPSVAGEAADVTVQLGGSSPTRLRASVIRRGGERYAVVHWHQIGSRAYTSEYALRWALTRQILAARSGDSVLARVAVPFDQTDPTRSLEDVAELGRPLKTALAALFDG